MNSEGDATVALAGEEPERHRTAPSHWRSTHRELVEAAVLAILVTLLVRTFVIQAFRIPSGSMEDTLLVGDFLFVNKFVYGARVPGLGLRLPAFRHPRPGDVIVFEFPADPGKDFIKRCVAVAGQTVEIREKQLYVDGVRQADAFAKHADPRVMRGQGNPRDNFGPEVVPAGRLFMLGDNRDLSHDSRYWGYLDQDLIRGRAMFIYWSWDAAHKAWGFMPRARWSRIGDVIR